MPYENILLDIHDGVAWITLNRPDQMNPLDRSTVKELLACVSTLEANPEVGVIAIAGAGRAFSAGERPARRSERAPLMTPPSFG